MYVIYKQVGTRLGVLDTTDGVIEYMQKDAIQGLVDSGIEVKGFNGSREDVRLDWKLCNWLKKGGNIFEAARCFKKTADFRFQFYAENKTYRGIVLNYGDDVITLRFYEGIIVEVPRVMLEG